MRCRRPNRRDSEVVSLMFRRVRLLARREALRNVGVLPRYQVEVCRQREIAEVFDELDYCEGRLRELGFGGGEDVIASEGEIPF